MLEPAANDEAPVAMLAVPSEKLSHDKGEHEHVEHAHGHCARGRALQDALRNF